MRPGLSAVSQLLVDQYRRQMRCIARASGFAGWESAQRAAGLPVTPRRAALVTLTLTLRAAVPYLPADGSNNLAAVGLDDRHRFVRGLLRSLAARAAAADRVLGGSGRRRVVAAPCS
ncbi:hypothetical protein SAMN05428954_0038 [Streptomyces sp. 2112.3]|nr:hypothetical protein SAMN05428954_0038 [Streptomyces sp. 2112.3]